MNLELACIISFVTQETTETLKPEAFTFQGEADKTIHGLKWLPQKKQRKCVLIINHGMAEHIARYHDFAVYLASRGIAVYGEDHRGHGKTAGDQSAFGYFSDEKGWMRVISDIRALSLLAMSENKNLPVIMFGHSMGSFFTRHYLSLYGSELHAAVLSGTGNQGLPLLKAARAMAQIESLVKGKTHPSRFLDKLTFGSFNKPFALDGNTGFEWLSRDKKKVKEYAEDPSCGFICSAGFFSDLFFGLQIIRKVKCFEAVPEDLAILLYAGDKDPVGENGKAVKAVADLYKKSGIKDLTLILKEDMRHECLNEINREAVYKEIYDWIAARIEAEKQ